MSQRNVVMTLLPTWRRLRESSSLNLQIDDQRNIKDEMVGQKEGGSCGSYSEVGMGIGHSSKPNGVDVVVRL
jgi:hypothetical protein